MCPKCGVVYDKELDEMFERILFTDGWDCQEGNPIMYVFDKRGMSRRPDSPHPKARRVIFKLPTNMPVDR